MAEKITCPECGEEFDLGEGYKKHLEALEKKAVIDADKRNKEDYEKKLEQGRKKDKEISEAKVKAEKEKTDKIQQELLAEKQEERKLTSNTRIITQIFLQQKLSPKRKT